MVVAHRDLLVLLHAAPLNAANGDPAHKLVVVDGGHQHLEGGVQIHLGGGNIVDDGVEKGFQVAARHVGLDGGSTLPPGAEEHGGIQLLIGGVQIQQQLQALVDDLVHPLVGAVDLVYHHNHLVAQLQGLGQHKPCLGHGALGGVNQQDNAVDHLQDALHLAAEVGVARSVHNVDLHPAVLNGGNASLALQVTRVHYPVGDRLIFPVDAGLLEHFVHQGGLAVVHVGDDGDIS